MITLKNLTVSLGNVEILSGIDLEVKAGQWICLVGPNGAGKSTLIRTLLGVLSYSGNALEDDIEIYKNEKRQVAYVPQNPQIPAGMRIHEYVALGRRKVDGWSVESKSSRELIEKTLQDSGLWALRNRNLSEISGGELQRAHIARVLVQGAKLILLDEPTSALDLHHQISVLNTIEKLKSEGVTIVSTMHDLTLAAMYADEIAVLSEGKLLNYGPAQEIIHGADLKDAFKNRISVFTLDSGNPVILPQKDF
jgi:iron complex transport system ATP-binding protein